MPMCMKKGGINKIPASRAIDNDHETDGHTPEDVKGQVSGLQFSHKRGRADFGNPIKLANQAGNRNSKKCILTYFRVTIAYELGE